MPPYSLSSSRIESAAGGPAPVSNGARRWPGLLLLLLGMALALLPAGIGTGWPALIALWLAQPALALGCAWCWPAAEAAPRRAWRRDAATLAMLWGMALLLFGLALAWPYLNLLQSGSLASALGFAALLGLALSLLWRQWTLFAYAARHGGRIENLAAAVPGAWSIGRGLSLACALLFALAGAWLVAWPPAGLPPLVLVPGYALGLAIVHVALQRWGHPPPPPPVSESRQEEGRGTDAGDVAVPETEDASVALYAAAAAGQIERALALLEQGGDPQALPDPAAPDQRSLPMLAALLPDLRLLRELIARGVDLQREHAGLTPLLAATRDSWHGRGDAVAMLLANGADPRHADAEGNTPLHHAARGSDPAICAQLLDAGAAIDACNFEGNSPLALALIAGHGRMARLLLERGAATEPAQGNPAMLAAARGEEDDPLGVLLLLKFKAKVDVRDARGRSALLDAVAMGHRHIVQALLEAGARVDVVDREGRNALLEAAAGPDPGILPLVLAKRPDPAAVDAGDRNALALACLAGVEPERLRLLCDFGVDTERRDLAGRRPVDHAVAAGRWALVAVLDPEHPLPESESAQWRGEPRPARDRLHEALRLGDFAAAKVVLSAVDAPLAAARSMLLLEYAGVEDRPAFEWLLRHGARLDDRLSAMDSVGFLLLDRGLSAETGLRAAAAQGQWPQGAGALARWLRACADQPAAALPWALELLQIGADPFAPAPTGEHALGLAAAHGLQPLLDALLQCGLDPALRDARGQTPLHLAVARGHEAAVRSLVRHGAPTEARAADGQTPYGLALARGRGELAAWLEWSPWQLPRRVLRSHDLPAAALQNDRAAVRRLLALGLPIDGSDAQGCTALLRAAGGGHLDLVEDLIAAGAALDATARSGATPLSAAISMRHAAVVERLLAAGASTAQVLPGGITPLMLAAALGQPELVSGLLARNADIEARDAQGLSPLHCAALFAFSSSQASLVRTLFEVLLQAGADPEARSTSGQTPLLLLLGARAEPGAGYHEPVLLDALDRLLEEGVSLEVVEHRGLTALHLAVLHGMAAVVDRLLEAGADAGLRDRLGRTAADLALLRGYVDLASRFAQQRRLPTRPRVTGTMPRA